MSRLVASITIFLAVLSQMLFMTEKNVLYANIISLPVFISFVVTFLRSKKIYINLPLKLYLLLSLYWVASIIWHPYNYNVDLTDITKFFVIWTFLLFIYNLMIQENCSNILGWAYIATVFINFSLLFTNKSQLLGNLYRGTRFQGTFENPNDAALAFFSGMIFSFFHLDSKSKLLKFIAWSAIACAVVLILTTASKKGTVLLLAALVFLIPSYLRNLSWKQIIVYVSLLIISITLPFIYLDELGIAESVSLTEKRWKEFSDSITNTKYKADSTAERIYFIKQGIAGFTDQPIMGHGVNAFSSYYQTYSHCNYIELLFNGGLVAFVLFYGIHFHLFKNLSNLYDKKLKALCVFLLLYLLLTDFAAVTYYTKYSLYLLIFISVLLNSRMSTDYEKKNSFS